MILTMETTHHLVKEFIKQATSGDLKTSKYPKELYGLKLKVSFGMGAPARVPWMALTTPEISVSNGFYPALLFYKDLNVLILCFGISETVEYIETWPEEIIRKAETIVGYLDEKVPRYGNSFVFKAYNVSQKNNEPLLINRDNGNEVSDNDIDSDFSTITEQYKQITKYTNENPKSAISQGVSYLEKQLEDFIIQNWENTELGKKYDLIIEDGELKSQQYRTDVGPIDILVKDKVNNNFVVIELKRNQTGRETIGQITSYMGWVEKKLGDENVKGIIIAKEFDKNLEYAVSRVKDIEVYAYQLNFLITEMFAEKK